MGNCFSDTRPNDKEINSIIWENAALSTERHRSRAYEFNSTTAFCPSSSLKEEECLRSLLKSLCDSRQSLLKTSIYLDEEIEMAVHDSKSLERNVRHLIHRIDLSQIPSEGGRDSEDCDEEDLEFNVAIVQGAVSAWLRRVSLLID